MALSYDVQFGGSVNINVRFGEDANSITFNIKDSAGNTYDVSNFTNTVFNIYAVEGMKEADYIVQISGLSPASGAVPVSWDWSTSMTKLRNGYKYYYRILTDDTGYSNQRLIPVQGEFFVGV